jgi:hypothetical protein
MPQKTRPRRYATPCGRGRRERKESEPRIDADLGLGFDHDAGAIETLSLVTACFILLVVCALRE